MVGGVAAPARTMSAMILVWRWFGKPDPSMLANAMLVGLVAITAPCAFVNSVSAVIIGGGRPCRVRCRGAADLAGAGSHLFSRIQV
jgi:ammonia channel protein AmtB